MKTQPSHHSADKRAPAAAKPTAPRPEIDSLNEDDPIDQASYDSFPASDPPAHSSRRAQPGGKRDKH